MASQLVKSVQAATKKINLEGVHVALTTPFDLQENIAYDKLKDNLAKYEKTPLAGYVVAGSTGQAPALNPQERVELVKHVRQSVAKEKLVIGNATSESTKTASEMCEAMSAAGADGVMVMVPFYYKKKMTNEAIVQHFTTVADRSPVPVIIYDGVASGIDISIDTLTNLAAHPNIVGVKQSDVRKIAGTIAETRNKGFDFEVLVSTASYMLPAMQCGCRGGLMGLPSALAQEVCDLYSLAKQQKWKEAIDLHRKVTRVDTSTLDVPLLKVAMDMLGLYGGPSRKPLLNSSTSEVASIKKILTEEGFLKG